MKKHRPRTRHPKRKTKPAAPQTDLRHATGYFHGGKPGLPVGSYILPARETNSVREDVLKLVEERGLPEHYDPSSAYVTTDLAWAMLYACYHSSRLGVVYEVEPHGELIEDPDQYDFGAFKCSRARILKIARLPVGKMDKLRLRFYRGECRSGGQGMVDDYLFLRAES